MPPEQPSTAAARRRKNLALCMALLGLAAVLYLLTLVKLSGQ